MITFLKRKWVEISIYIESILFSILCGPWYTRNYLSLRRDKPHELHYNEQHERCTLSVYTPEETSASEAKCPALLFTHGGTWIHGERGLYHQLGKFLQSKGIICIIMNYRLYPTAYLEDMIDDCDKAIDFILGNKDKFDERADWSKFMVMGHSAGAHLLSCLLVSKVRGKVNSSYNLKDIHTFFALSGVYNLQKHYSYETQNLVHIVSPMWKVSRGVHRFPKFSPTLILKEKLTDEERQELQQNSPNVIVVHGKDDYRCPLYQATEYADAVKSVVGEEKCSLIELDNYCHGDVIMGFMGIDPEHRRDAVWLVLHDYIIDH